MQGVTLDSQRTIRQYAQVFRVHPRTIVRALVGIEASTKWSVLCEQKVTIRDMAESLGMEAKFLIRHMRNEDTMITKAEAMRNAGVNGFEWWKRAYEYSGARIKMDLRTARYSNKLIGQWASRPIRQKKVRR